ncbi:uncharacterized protein LOC102721596 [Oryza brachyantha]|uniref:uncharacterized protein LOC102721596 n=1 Tax=Oryza brachyantha TaxID=4533 RepID=UPI001ADB0064|nr:uncharacterized protein LOC102721596 [Oryza brachyantha]
MAAGQENRVLPPPRDLGVVVDIEDDSDAAERVDFDVADLSLRYNVMLGRPALVKFMVVTRCAYCQLKMPGPNGPITVHDDVKMALACAEMRANALATATTTASTDQGPEASASWAPKKRIISSDEVPIKLIQLGDDPSKAAKIGGSLDAK